MVKHKHLTLSDCFEIELSIRQGSSFREIVAKIEKDTSTVSKKIVNIQSLNNKINMKNFLLVIL